MLRPTQLAAPSACARPLLSLCMIVRDSARTLAECLASVRPYVDEIVVVDTGSHDITPQIALEFGARLFHFPWCDDFSAARNESLRHARGDWILWLDADDTLDPASGAQLRTLLYTTHQPTTLGYVMQVHCPAPSDSGNTQTTVVDHVKLVRNLPELRFEGRIHEQLLPAIRAQGGAVEWTNLFVVHSGVDHSRSARARKHERDLRILQLDLAQRPEHPFVLFNLGMTYADQGDHAQAITFLQRSLAAAGPEESHVRKAYALLVGSLLHEGHLSDAHEKCERARALFPHDTELAFRAGLVAHELGRLEEAEAAYRAALAPPAERVFSSVDQALGGYKARHNLALVLIEQGRPDLAEQEWRLALAEAPEFAPARCGLVDALLAQKRIAATAVLLERWYGGREDDPLACLLRALWHKAASDMTAAREGLARAAERFPTDEILAEAQCRFLFQHGPKEECRAALERLLALAPENAAAWHNLGAVLLGLGERELAKDALERSLELRPRAPITMALLELAAQPAERADENRAVAATAPSS